MRIIVCLAALAWLMAPIAAGAAKVTQIGPERIAVAMSGGVGQLPLFATGDWAHPAPDITRVVLVVHGLSRDGDVYFATGQAAQAASGVPAMIITPHFLADEDIAEHHLPADTLHWSRDGWGGGEPAHGPVPASSFAALDAILARLADRALFPHIAQVVVAGHSAGGQVVQRYAVVGNGDAALVGRGVHVRYVVANPSSYLYFDATRPGPVANCAGFNAWRYGFAGGQPPAYVTGDQATLERRYVARDVIYLLGTADTNPNHSALDKSCGAEAQGPYRLARGLAYVNYLRARHPGAHRLLEVPGVGHDGRHMLDSVCGRAALFATPGCPDQ